MKISRILTAMCIAIALAVAGLSRPTVPGYLSAPINESLSVSNPSGLTVSVADENVCPSVWLSIPNEQSGIHSVLVLLPEHVTVRRHGSDQAEHLYLWRPGKGGAGFNLKPAGNGFQWETDLEPGVHFLARISLEPDGILYHYEFINRSETDFDSVQAVTDPRMQSPLFHDTRFERTYFHTPKGFVLLAFDIPERLTMPLTTWLPNRYRVSFEWPVPNNRAEKQPDGIMFYNASARADLPVLVTTSIDHRWVMATFSRDPGNLWSNPELTCQHADAQAPLLHGNRTVLEEKTLLFRGGLEDVVGKVQQQRSALN